MPLKRQEGAGKPFNPHAESWDIFCDTAEQFKLHKDKPNPTNLPGTKSTTLIMVKNNSGAAHSRFDVLKLSTPIITRDQNEDDFLNRIAFNAVAINSDEGTFCIIQAPLADGEISKCGVIVGATVARIEIKDSSHTFAVYSSTHPAYLESAATGTIKLLYNPGAAADTYGYILLNGEDKIPVIRFELQQDKTPETSPVDAKRLDENDTPVGAVGHVYDPEYKYRGRGYTSGTRGSRGEAALINEKWYIISMESPALVISGYLSAGVTGSASGGTVSINNIDELQPIGALYTIGESGGEVSVRYEPEVTLDNGDKVVAFWDEVNDEYCLTVIDKYVTAYDGDVTPGTLYDKIVGDEAHIATEKDETGKRLRIMHIGPAGASGPVLPGVNSVHIITDGDDKKVEIRYSPLIKDYRGHIIGATGATACRSEALPAGATGQTGATGIPGASSPGIGATGPTGATGAGEGASGVLGYVSGDGTWISVGWDGANRKVSHIGPGAESTILTPIYNFTATTNPDQSISLKIYEHSIGYDAKGHVTGEGYLGDTIKEATVPAGATGIPGASGIGATGIPGASGIGATGIPGASGIGATGVPGASGIGATGIPGASGVNGASGPEGATGIPGASGPKGDKGDQGDQGYQGIPGATGPKGDKGDKGDQGDQGYQGIPGATGPKGDKGDKGDQGDQGYQGIPGATGPKGDKGDKGDQGDQGYCGGPGLTDSWRGRDNSSPNRSIR